MSSLSEEASICVQAKSRVAFNRIHVGHQRLDELEYSPIGSLKSAVQENVLTKSVWQMAKAAI